MDPIFKKCIMALERINDNSLPNLENQYKTYTKNIEHKATQSQCLNESKAIVTAASQAIENPDFSHNTIKKELNKLIEMDKKIINASKKLNELLTDKQSKYTDNLKLFVNRNHECLVLTKDGSKSAQELLMDIIKLGKDIQKYTNEDIPSYEKELTSFIKKTEDSICNETNQAYNVIQQLDEGTLPRVRAREWTYVEKQWMHRRGAFVDNSYV